MKLMKECLEYKPYSGAEVAECICNHLPSEEDIHQKILNLNPSASECCVAAAACKLRDAVKCYMDCIAEEYGLPGLESVNALDEVIHDIQAEGIDDPDIAAVFIAAPEVPPFLTEARDPSSSFVELEGFRTKSNKLREDIEEHYWRVVYRHPTGIYATAIVRGPDRYHAESVLRATYQPQSWSFEPISKERFEGLLEQGVPELDYEGKLVTTQGDDYSILPEEEVPDSINKDMQGLEERLEQNTVEENLNVNVDTDQQNINVAKEDSSVDIKIDSKDCDSAECAAEAELQELARDPKYTKAFAYLMRTLQPTEESVEEVDSQESLEEELESTSLRDALEDVTSIWVYNDVQNAHFTSEYPTELEEGIEPEFYPLEDLLFMSSEQLLNVPSEILTNQTNLELLDKVAHLDSSKLTSEQQQLLKKAYAQKVVIDRADVEHLIQKLKECKKLIIAERPENKSLLESLSVEDCLEIIKNLEVSDYAYSTKNYNLAHFGNQLIVFQPKEVVVEGKDIGPLTLYIKIDLDQSSGTATVAISFHPTSRANKHPYTESLNENDLITPTEDSEVDGSAEELELETEPPKGAEGTYMASVLGNLVKEEYDAIASYTSFLQDLEANNFGDESDRKVICDILAEENVHVGQLQELLKKVCPAAKNIEVGTEEARDQISEEETASD